jgi:hypothetical protein
VYFPTILIVTPGPVNVPEIVMLFFFDANARDSASMTSPFGVIVVVVATVVVVVGAVVVVVVESAPAEVATITTSSPTRATNRRDLSNIALLYYVQETAIKSTVYHDTFRHQPKCWNTERPERLALKAWKRVRFAPPSLPTRGVLAM